jgi:hypothetical protein
MDKTNKLSKEQWLHKYLEIKKEGHVNESTKPI